MSKLVTIKLKVVDLNGMSMPGFPLIRGPKNGQMAAEGYTDKLGIFEFKASPNREIIIKLLSPNNSFGETFTCMSGNNIKYFKISLKHSKSEYISKTKVIWFSKYSKTKIPHTVFQLKYFDKKVIYKTEDGSGEIQTIVGDIVELFYVFPNGIKLSQPIYYQARRINPKPLIIVVDNYIINATTDENKPTVPSTVDNKEVDCYSKFHKISKIILKHEGGFVNDPNDSGGATNKGIAWNTWKSFAQVDLGVLPTLENLRKITDDQAEVIYRKRYWEPKGFCEIKNDKVGLMIYDWIITSGGAAKEIQKLLVNTYNQKIIIDGGMGVKTIQALNSISDQDVLLKNITEIRKNYYISLAFDKKGNKTKNFKFLKGWLNRVDDCLRTEI